MATQELLKQLYGVWHSMKRRADAEVSPDHENTAGQRWTQIREQHLTIPNHHNALGRDSGKSSGNRLPRILFYHDDFSN